MHWRVLPRVKCWRWIKTNKTWLTERYDRKKSRILICDCNRFWSLQAGKTSLCRNRLTIHVFALMSHCSSRRTFPRKNCKIHLQHGAEEDVIHGENMKYNSRKTYVTHPVRRDLSEMFGPAVTSGNKFYLNRQGEEKNQWTSTRNTNMFVSSAQQPSCSFIAVFSDFCRKRAV